MLVQVPASVLVDDENRRQEKASSSKLPETLYVQEYLPSNTEIQFSDISLSKITCV